MPSQHINDKSLFCFGFGYVAKALAGRLAGQGWRIAGTARNAAGIETLRRLGFAGHLFDGQRPLAEAAALLHGVSHLLVSIPPGAGAPGDPVLAQHHAELAVLAPQLRWLGYLGTTGVYGDCGGALVTEDSPRRPSGQRGQRRLAAEDGWLDLWRHHGAPVHLFRLGGIYGPGRSPLERIQRGQARLIAKPGHRFGRIHVDDITGALLASWQRPRPGAVYNLVDDEPAEPSAVLAYAYRLLGLTPPPPVPFAEAAADMSAMALSFWQDNRAVSNQRLRRELGYDLRYPTYREGLESLL